MQRAANFLMDPSSMPELPPEEAQQASQEEESRDSEEQQRQHLNTTHDVSHVIENASPSDAMNDFLFGEGSDGLRTLLQQ